jgi:hypothetical protein
MTPMQVIVSSTADRGARDGHSTRSPARSRRERTPIWCSSPPIRIADVANFRKVRYVMRDGALRRPARSQISELSALARNERTKPNDRDR